MDLLKVNARFISGENSKPADMGLEVDSYELKEVMIHLDKVAFISEYEGCVCFNFSALDEDCLISDLDYNVFTSDESFNTQLN